jgi:hypothetical protein
VDPRNPSWGSNLDRIMDEQFPDEAIPIEQLWLCVWLGEDRTTLYTQEKQINAWYTMFYMYN